MTTAHDFPDISLSSIGTNGSSPGRHGGRLSTFDDDEFVSASSHFGPAGDYSEVVPNSTVASGRTSEVVPDSTRNTRYRESLSLFDDDDDDGGLDVSRALPPRRARPMPSPVLEEIDNEENEEAPRTPEPRTLRFSLDAEGDEVDDDNGANDGVSDDNYENEVVASPSRVYPRLSALKDDTNFRHLDYTHLSKRKGSYRSQLAASPASERSPAIRSGDSSFVRQPQQLQLQQTKQCDCGSQAHNASSDQVYAGLERRFADALHVSGNLQQLQLHDKEEAESAGCIMAGVLALIESRCCDEAAMVVRRRLREMGATVNRTPSAAITHVIWSNGGDSSVLRDVLASCSQRPHVLPPAWVHESYESGHRLPEVDYSLCNDRYVKGVERRRSSVMTSAVPAGAAAAANTTSSTIDVSMEISAAGVADRTEFSDLTFDSSMTASQLLAKIDIMAKRLEKVADDPVQHAIRCASRTAAAAAARQPRPTFVPQQLPRLLRRRSHDGFSLAHRRPDYDSEAMKIREASRDILEVLPTAPAAASAARAALVGVAARVVDGVDDMRRTVETDLNRIRQTLRNNANYSQRGGRGRGGASQSMRRGTPKSHFTFLLPSSPRSPDTHRKGRPSIAVVKTQSKMINNLQAVHSSEEFAKGRKETVSRKRIAMLTGFGSRDERQMLALADAIQLKITKEMSDSLRAVVSSDGARTVSTLRAVVLGVPVVTEDWLRACKRANRLLHTLPYEWPQWAELAKKRESTRRGVFAAVGGKIKVCDLCTPSTPILKELVMKSGGWLTSEASEAKLIVAPTGVYHSRRDGGGGIVVDEKYILDCITANKMIPLPGETETLDDSVLSEE